ncbi:RNA methyltransferase [Phototrophicus methaneseepsis]|uniref:RNA methyltransferase n=1 Tax=Phototrophicus methaneseepsis TaxID=2710758 RepID=A0A7S8E9P0_9CHLR|nr:RNA methyltransferase [Phototrophicus methaneseepsis]QPC82956.1 RNA methyltransferase [Phototrophicus methaneseepsis]
MPSQEVLEGHISVRAAIEAHSRPIETLYIREGILNKSAHALLRLAQAEQIPFERVPDAMIEQVTNGNSHGGVAALVGERRTLPLAELAQDEAAPLIIMLDGQEDPFNFGQAVRSLYAAGVHGLVLRPREWASATSIVARSSAGASERIPIAYAETAEDAVQHFKARGMQAVALDADPKASTIYAYDWRQPTFALIGGEKRGLSRGIANAVDAVLQLPYGRDFRRSLGMSPTAAVVAFEAMRQRLS